jgi:hypothetical protein
MEPITLTLTILGLVFGLAGAVFAAWQVRIGYKQIQHSSKKLPLANEIHTSLVAEPSRQPEPEIEFVAFPSSLTNYEAAGLGALFDRFVT